MWYGPRITRIVLAVSCLATLAACDSHPIGHAEPTASGAARQEVTADTMYEGTSSEAGVAENQPAADTTGRGGVFVGSGH
jgi:hypothetical protein